MDNESTDPMICNADTPDVVVARLGVALASLAKASQQLWCHVTPAKRSGGEIRISQRSMAFDYFDEIDDISDALCDSETLLRRLDSSISDGELRTLGELLARGFMAVLATHTAMVRGALELGPKDDSLNRRVGRVERALRQYEQTMREHCVELRQLEGAQGHTELDSKRTRKRYSVVLNEMLTLVAEAKNEPELLILAREGLQHAVEEVRVSCTFLGVALELDVGSAVPVALTAGPFSLKGDM